MNQRKLEKIVGLFRPKPLTTYLDTATYGLAPVTTIEAIRDALDHWADGSARWLEDWDMVGEKARSLFAKILHGSPEEIALLPSASIATGIVASSIPPKGEVLLAEGDYSSVTFPFLAQQDRGNFSTRVLPLKKIVDSISSRTSLVAVSAVQSSDGTVIDLEEIRQATHRVGARLFLDASQALGSFPINVNALDLDYVAVSAYKWLCCPRGVACLWIRPGLWNEPTPLLASWRSADEPYSRYYSPSLCLAPNARMFDTAIAWQIWVGAVKSLEAICELDDQLRFQSGHTAVLTFADLMDLEPPKSNIITMPVAEPERVLSHAAAAGLRISIRNGKARLAFHFYNSVDDARLAARVLSRFRLTRQQILKRLSY